MEISQPLQYLDSSGAGGGAGFKQLGEELAKTETAVSNLLKNRFNTLPLSPLRAGLRPVIVFMPYLDLLHVVLLEFPFQLPPVVFLASLNLTFKSL